MKLFIAFLINLFCLSIPSQEILEVGIYRNVKIRTAHFSYSSTDYQIVANDSTPVMLVSKGTKITIKRRGDEVQLSEGEKILGTYKSEGFLEQKKRAFLI